MSFDPDALTDELMAGAVVPNGQRPPDDEPPDDEPPDDEPVIAPADRLRAMMLTTEQVKALPAPEPLVDGLLFRDSLALLYGPSGIGKSFLALDLAEHVTYDRKWQGRPVAGGSVVYVIAEGVGGFGARIEAWERHAHLSREVHPARWVPQAVNVFEPTWAEALAEVVTEVRPHLVVLDTLARCTTGAEENSARDAGKVIHNLDVIRRAARSCVLLVHHPGKNTDAGARGSSALRAAMDTEAELSGESHRFTLKITKQKDAAEAAPMTLGLVPVAGTGSVAVDLATGSGDPDDLPAAVAVTLKALIDIDVPGGVPSTAWLKASGTPDRSFYRHRAGLLEKGLVTNVGTEKRPYYRPVDLLTGAHIDP